MKKWIKNWLWSLLADKVEISVSEIVDAQEQLRSDVMQHSIELGGVDAQVQAIARELQQTRDTMRAELDKVNSRLSKLERIVERQATQLRDKGTL